MVCPFTRLWNIRQDTWFFVRLSFLLYLYIYAVFCPILVLQLDDKRMNIQKSFQTLGLGKGASPRAAKSAYRKLVKTYHPDRFVHDPDGSHAAEETIKQINDAYGRIQSYFSSRSSTCQNNIKSKVQTQNPKQQRTNSSGNIKKRGGQTNRPDSIKQNRASFTLILEQAIKSQRYRTSHAYEKQMKEGKATTLRKVATNYHSYTRNRNSSNQDSGGIHEIKPVSPVPPVHPRYHS